MQARAVAASRPRPWRGAELLVLIAALIPRLAIVLAKGGGLRGKYPYDPSVYYSAADALLHGRLPYRDYVLLHPPGVVLVASPFAGLGELTSDHRGFVAANLAFTLLGALNAVLVVRVATRLGLPRGAAVVGGLCYAVWIGTVAAEYALRLEPLGNFVVLCGLLAYARGADDPRRRWPLLAGVGFGAAAAVKIWYVVPLLLIALWLIRPARRTQLPRFLAGAGATLLIIDGPFFVLAPRQMWSMVVTDQLSRAAEDGGVVRRLVEVTGAQIVDPAVPDAVQRLVLVPVALLVVAMSVAALRVPNGAMPVTLLTAELLVLVFSPGWFTFYDDYAAPGLALTVAAAAAWLARTERVPRPVSAVAVGLAASAIGVATVALPPAMVEPYPGARLAAAVPRSGCVMSDSPMALIALNVLSRDFAAGCPNWVDVTGRTYGPDREVDRDGRWVPRAQNLRWQRDLTRYLLSGDAVTLERPGWTGIGVELRRALSGLPVLARAGGFAVYGTSGSAAR